MQGLTQQEITTLFLALAVLLGSARLLGELATRYHQPAVLGEILAGILLGPTCFGALAPEWNRFLFPTTGNFPIALDGLTAVGIALFLLVAGMEVDLSTVFRQGKAAFYVGVTGMSIPFMLGLLLGWSFPQHVGAGEEADRWTFALFLATALSITALPVIVKILIDLNLFRSDVGMIILAAAILHDLIGWNIFAVILGMIEGGGGLRNLLSTVALTVFFVLLMLTLGRRFIDWILPWIQAHMNWPAGVLGFAMTGGLLCAAFTEMIGIHAVFGAFIFGIALGDSAHLRAHTRTILEQFISSIFAPIFFASIGLKLNFAANFDFVLLLILLAVGVTGKVAGCTLAARIAGIKRRESLAIGFALSAHGAMEIILGLLALKAELITERLFVTLVLMALCTTMTSGGITERLLSRKRKARLLNLLNAKRFIPQLKAEDSRQAIEELVQLACAGAGIDKTTVFEAVWAREQTMSTSLDHGLAVPHARLEGLKSPIVAAGMSPGGLDFNSMDGQPTHLIFLLLTPHNDHRVQLELLADIGNIFKNPELIERCLDIANFTRFMALIKNQENERRKTTESFIGAE